MLQDKIINSALGTAEPPVFADRSRCVRMRFNKNTCSLCTASCRSGAISLDNGISVDGEKCSECLLCLSECPSGCFSAADEDFFVLLSRLRKTQESVLRPVLGCKNAKEAEAHEKTGCLGFLSEEHLIALSQFLNKPLYLNLTACGACRNSFIVARLKRRIESVGKKMSFDIGKRIFPAETKEQLVFEDLSLDRRGFFLALKREGVSRIAALMEKKDDEISLSYGEKKNPVKRNILNAVVRTLAGGNAIPGLLRSYAFTVRTGPLCNNCFACIGMCPTGALRIRKDEKGAGLLFNSSLCTGCALCRDFCRAGALTLSQGFNGNQYFHYASCAVDGQVSSVPAELMKS